MAGARAGKRRGLQAIGLARKAGRVVLGTRAVREAMARGELELIVVARDASGNAVRRLGLKGGPGPGGPPVVRAATRAELGSALGRGPLAAVGIADAGLARKIRGELEREDDD